ncbi:MAG: PQQ-binding-like beta-propeller repeat protein [Planctomycetes bacterium]|nr:PQQ-binding-like beta-propeller repeat protein [Planctomycetota bacterium]
MNLGKMVAFDRETGEQAWVTKENRGHAYSTPAPFELDGRTYLASLCGDGLVIIDGTDGSEIDFYSWGNRLKISPMTPIVIGDRIFVSAGYNHGCTMLRLTDGNLQEVWASNTMRNKMSGCILWEDHLYGFDESILKCIDLDGNEKWRQRGLGTGALSIAGGRIVILDGKGRVIVAKANPTEYVELSRQEVLSGGTFWSTPVLSHGRVYCRSSLGQMACLDFTKSDAGSDSQH